MAYTTDVTKEKLVADLKIVLADAEEIIRNSASATGEKAAELRARATERIAAARQNVAALTETAGVKLVEAGKATDACVRKHPWQTAGVAAAVGFVLGVLVSRRS